MLGKALAENQVLILVSFLIQLVKYGVSINEDLQIIVEENIYNIEIIEVCKTKEFQENSDYLP